MTEQWRKLLKPWVQRYFDDLIADSVLRVHLFANLALRLAGLPPNRRQVDCSGGDHQRLNPHPKGAVQSFPNNLLHLGGTALGPRIYLSAFSYTPALGVSHLDLLSEDLA